MIGVDDASGVPAANVVEDVRSDGEDDAAEEDNGSDDDDSLDASDSSNEEKEVSAKCSKWSLFSSKTKGSSKCSKKTKLITWQLPYKHHHAHHIYIISSLSLRVFTK